MNKNAITFNHKIDAAHFVPDCNSKCENIHGHTWHIKIELEGGVKKDGMIVDFGELKELLNKLDHGSNHMIFTPIRIRHPQYGEGWLVKNIMNDIVPVPTAENLAQYIHNQIMTKYSNIDYCSVTVEESPGKSATYS